MKSGYAPVNGLRMYYEIHGSGGEPLILLHGGAIGIAMFGANVEALAKTRTVVAVEFQGHGRTADIERPLTYEGLAEDVAGLMRYVNIDRADVMGYSLGAEVALQLVFRHAELVRKLVIVSGAFSREGWYAEVRAAFEQMGAAAAQPLKNSPFAKMYPDVNWENLFTKLGELLRKDYDWSNQVEAMEAPTLLVFADADALRPEHMVKFYELVGGGKRDAGLDGSGRSVNQLAILPGLTHYMMGAAPELAVVAEKFLSSGAK